MSRASEGQADVNERFTAGAHRSQGPSSLVISNRVVSCVCGLFFMLYRDFYNRRMVSIVIRKEMPAGPCRCESHGPFRLQP
jgi:hypothetical protein